MSDSALRRPRDLIADLDDRQATASRCVDPALLPLACDTSAAGSIDRPIPVARSPRPDKPRKWSGASRDTTVSPLDFRRKCRQQVELQDPPVESISLGRVDDDGHRRRRQLTHSFDRDPAVHASSAASFRQLDAAGTVRVVRKQHFEPLDVNGDPARRRDARQCIPEHACSNLRRLIRESGSTHADSRFRRFGVLDQPARDKHVERTRIGGRLGCRPPDNADPPGTECTRHSGRDIRSDSISEEPRIAIGGILAPLEGPRTREGHDRVSPHRQPGSGEDSTPDRNSAQTTTP